jgi:tetratricopeptide (TPR) repeat protein
MMAALRMLRRLAERHDYATLREVCLGADSTDPAVQVLLAMAEAHLGNDSAARCRLASLDRGQLRVDSRIDLAAVHAALGELDQATALLESARRGHGTLEPADHARLLARLAWCRLQQGLHDDALALYEQSLGVRPFVAVYQNLLRLYRDRGRLSEMERCLDAAWRFWAVEQADWPDDACRYQSRQLRAVQLDLWLDSERFEAAEAWVDEQQDVLGEDDWCALVSDLAEQLAARNRHPQAEEWLRAGLRRYPKHLALYGKLAELAQLQGRPLQAIALLRRAILLADAQDQPTALLWIRLSAAALPANPRLARAAADEAREQLARRTQCPPGGAEDVAETTLQVELALADVEAAEQDCAAAEQRYRQVLLHRPHSVPALLGLGRLLLQLGRIDEAVQTFRRVTTTDPVRGYGALIHARRFPEDEDTLQRLEQLARTPGLHGPVRTSLLFQLAAARERRAEYDRAFALADEANAASRRLLRYDPVAHRQRCARIRHAFPKALYEHRTDCGHESTVPVFVVGMPRSGTSLVEQIIAGHSRIHGAGELGTIPRVIAGLERWERHTGSGRRYPDCVDDLDATVIRGIAEIILKELRQYDPEADHVVDKLPHNFENVGLIRLLFPRARIISVRRDPRDVAVSNFFLDYAAKHGAMGFAYDLDWIGEQLADHNLLMRHWQQVWPGGILEIHYEDLVSDLEQSARRMLDHIGVDWEPQVLDFDVLERPVRTASAWQVRQPLYAGSKGRWRHFRRHLKPLLAATNRNIRWEPIEMVTLPEPGWLNVGVDHFRQGDLEAAEYRFRLLLHHLPEHAAARFMLGLICLRTSRADEGIALMEHALERCPWKSHWRSDLTRAYRLAGRGQDAAALARGHLATFDPEPGVGEMPAERLDYLFLSGESTCSTHGPARSGANC